jgi:predicted RNA methylase
VVAEHLNRVLREVAIKDEFRPACAGAVIVARWHAGELAPTASSVNAACADAFGGAGRADLGAPLRLPVGNVALEQRLPELFAMLGSLGGRDADELGDLYEASFRYTGGNSIGQYFTPRHITEWMADLVGLEPGDRMLDPACGSGGFLVAGWRRGVRTALAWETEPTTAALCAANALLRGVPLDGLRCGDVFADAAVADARADVVLMNPPFPHRRTDTPSVRFVDRALAGLRPGGRLAAVLPASVLSKRDQLRWREAHRSELAAVVQLPGELFEPYASVTTAVIVLEKGRERGSAVFVRAARDGLALKKGVRVPRGESDLPRAIMAVQSATDVPGFAGVCEVGAEWSPGAFIPSAVASTEELRAGIDALLRRMASFYVRYAREVAVQRERIAGGELALVDYFDVVSAARLRNAAALPRTPGTVGEAFTLLYGMKELHSRDGIAPGDALIISPTEAYNGCYGWMHFEPVLRGPFVTIAQTGSIGEAFVQLEPCAVNDDCLVLLPRDDVGLADLVIAAAALRLEKWRFSYGRKLTPARIVELPLPDDADLRAWTMAQLDGWRVLCEQAVARYPKG